MTFISREETEQRSHRHIHTNVKNAPFLEFQEQGKKEEKEMSLNTLTGKVLMHCFPT